MADKNFRMHKLTTMQLHSAVVHLTDMVKAYGPTAFRMEFWVERMMQELKRVTKFRTSCSPELVAVNAALLKRALARMPSHVHDVDRLLRIIDPKHKTSNPPGRDESDANGNVLVGSLCASDASDEAADQVCTLATTCIACPHGHGHFLPANKFFWSSLLMHCSESS